MQDGGPCQAEAWRGAGFGSGLWLSVFSGPHFPNCKMRREGESRNLIMCVQKALETKNINGGVVAVPGGRLETLALGLPGSAPLPSQTHAFPWLQTAHRP